LLVTHCTVVMACECRPADQALYSFSTNVIYPCGTICAGLWCQGI